MGVRTQETFSANGSWVGDALEKIRIKAQNVLERSQSLLDRRTGANPYKATNISRTLARRRARVISVCLFLLAVSVWAVTLAVYYAFVWTPCTKKILCHVGDDCARALVPELIAEEEQPITFSDVCPKT